MLISSDANAAQSHAPGEATRFFDDIGCLAVDMQSRAAGALRYVRLGSGKWASVESSFFAISQRTRTPMDYGILAFAQRDQAQAADRDSKARSWPDAVAYAEAR